MHTLLALALVAAGAGDVEVFLTSDRRPVDKPPKGIGNDFLETRLELGNLKLWYRAAVDPHNDDAPVRFGYGDFFFGCDFGRQGNGGWNLWNFTGATVATAGGKPVGLFRRAEGVHVVERGARAMADVAWWPLGAERTPTSIVAIRFVKRAGEAKWAYIETSVAPESPLALASVWYSAFPGNTSGPPGRERWVTTPARSHNLMTGEVSLDPAREWAVSLHNKNGHERAGSLLVFDPAEVAAAKVSGTYGVTIRLTPKAGAKRLHVAVGYFLGEHHRDANAAFLGAAPASLERLRKVGWAANIDRLHEAWTRQMKELAEPLRLVADDVELSMRLDGVCTAYEEARQAAIACRKQGKPVPRGTERRLADRFADLAAARDTLFAGAVKALLEGQP